MEEIGELEGKTFYILGMKTFIFIAHHLKEKAGRIVLNSTAFMEEIGELKGKKFLFEEILVFQRRSGATIYKGRGDFRFDFHLLLSLQRYGKLPI